MKSLMLMSAIVFAAPAMAQSASAPASTNMVEPATTAQAPQPATDAPVAQTPAQPATTTNPADAVATVVKADWSKYDTDSNNALSKAEFGKWMVALREQNAAAQKQAVPDVNAWANAAFAQADKDKSGGVTRPELEGFLKG